MGFDDNKLFWFLKQAKLQASNSSHRASAYCHTYPAFMDWCPLKPWTKKKNVIFPQIYFFHIICYRDQESDYLGEQFVDSLAKGFLPSVMRTFLR